MKNIRYAYASVSYHKKTSVSLGLFSGLFLVLSTSILNLIDLENTFYQQVKDLANLSDYLKNHQKFIHLFLVMYIILLVVALFIIGLLIFSTLRLKRQDMLKWRIMGFKRSFIIKQAVLETLIPLMIGIFFAAFALLVCQHTYEFLLIRIKPILAAQFGIERVTFFSPNLVVERTPNQVMTANGNTTFISLGITNLPISVIFKAFLKNCLILTGTTTLVTSISTYLFLKKRIQY